ncbi:Apulose-4-phosphate transketolase subunit A [Austwickia sp. TVS 96-490-7B]|uniref:transketolase n=1 Tax=Austwickia sp. TVS 96-490-7B TaxID=2830843 RepID=UPI001C58AAFF|nr:transketolase [Austwickia sp. TVS 96-490-7B]MBW3084303.1 Apulose-4-phosphate transketolase subunit A [Austwickia sp. TVS 96-490-7B]
MALTRTQRHALETKAAQLRRSTIDVTYWAGSAHIGGGLSVNDLMTYLYYHHMRINPHDPHDPHRDRFLLSKGHCAVAYVGVLADLGWLPTEELKEFNLTGSRLGMHLDANKVTGVEASTGSLGHGMSLALGFALAARQLHHAWRTYCIVGDGELNEGSNWEAAMAMAHYRLDNLVIVVDRNRCMIDGPTEDVMALEPLDDKFRAFGFDVTRIDGHDYQAIDDAFSHAATVTGKPCCIVADTIKACGVDFMAGDYRWHYGAINDEIHARCLDALTRYDAQRLAALDDAFAATASTYGQEH